MNIVATGTPAEQAIAAFFAEREATAASGLMGELRAEGYQRFVRQGLPHRRVEDWKYTDLRTLLREAYPPSTALDSAIEAHRDGGVFDHVDGPRLTIINGFLHDADEAREETPGGLEIHSLAKIAADPPDWFRQALGKSFKDARDDTILSLNNAFAQAGCVIRVKAGTSGGAPLRLNFVFGSDKPLAAFSRHLVLAEEGAEVTILESHRGRGAYQSNTVLELLAEKGARIEHVKLQQDSPDAMHLHLLGMHLEEKATIRSLAMSLGAGIARNQMHIGLYGEYAHAAATGAFLLNGKQHCDSTLVVDHAVPNCTSSQLFKGVLDGQSKGVFQGKIVVRPHAQKTDGYQSSKALLLSDTAEMNSKPELEIFADDVKCSHGSTSGKIDQDLMFYLRSRGIPEHEAESLLVQAFIGEAVEEAADAEVRDILIAAAERWLEARSED